MKSRINLKKLSEVSMVLQRRGVTRKMCYLAGFYINLSTILRAIPRNFSWGALSLRLPTKVGVVDDRWPWPIKFAVLYTMELWRYGKA